MGRILCLTCPRPPARRPIEALPPDGMRSTNRDTGDSSIGSFTASATLQADFDAATNTVSGTITGFSNDPSWSLALKRGDISGGNVGVAADGVTWTIDGVPDDSGAWEATFYSNLPTAGR